MAQLHVIRELDRLGIECPTIIKESGVVAPSMLFWRKIKERCGVSVEARAIRWRHDGGSVQDLKIMIVMSSLTISEVCLKPANAGRWENVRIITRRARGGSLYERLLALPVNY